MITLITSIIVLMIVCQIFAIGIKAAWGLTKIICIGFILPMVAIGLVLAGIKYVLIPVLVVAAIVAVIRRVTA